LSVSIEKAPRRTIDNRRVTLDVFADAGHILTMEIESIRHKGLRRFFETGNAKGVVGDAGRLRKMLAFIDAAESLEELDTPPNFGLHELTGDRSGTWSMTVTKNWRLTCVSACKTDPHLGDIGVQK